MRINLRRVAAPMAATLLAAGAITFSAAPAGAHVEVTPSTTTAGEYAELTFAVGHGCDGSSTTKLAIDIPEGIDVVTPTVKPGWNITKKTSPPDGSGGENERVSRVTYTAKTPLPDGYRTTFTLAAPLPDKPGETLTFPAVQTCVKGKTNWTQVPKDGQSSDDLETPAPALELTAADDAQNASTSAESGGDSTQAADASDGSSGTDATTWVALAVGVAGLAVGGTALARTRTRS